MTAKPKTQVQKFREAARELETDDDEKHFDKKLEQIARQKPVVEPKPKKEPGK